jgi:small subunit ribosomal protein S21
MARIVSDAGQEVTGLAEIQLHDGETVESALKRFKRKVLQEDIIKDIKRHAFYLKPGERKRLKSKLARKRSRKKRSREKGIDPARSGNLQSPFELSLCANRKTVPRTGSADLALILFPIIRSLIHVFIELTACCR